MPPVRLDPASAATPPLLSLQVLRAAAALLVLVHHAGYDADTIAERTARTPFGLDRFFDWGFGIHLFFVISGFIMVRTARGYGSAWGGLVFLTRRIIRVVPLYWLMTSLVLAGAALAPELLNMPVGGSAVVVGSYAFFPVLRDGGELRPVLGQGWTLDYEMFFYVLFAMSMLLPRRPGLVGLASALVGLVLIGQVAHPADAALGVWTDTLLLEFLFGVAIGLVQEAGSRLGTRTAVAGMVAGVGSAIAFGPACAACGGLQAWIGQGIPAALIVAACVLGPAWPVTRGDLGPGGDRRRVLQSLPLPSFRDPCSSQCLAGRHAALGAARRRTHARLWRGGRGSASSAPLGRSTHDVLAAKAQPSCALRSAPHHDGSRIGCCRRRALITLRRARPIGGAGSSRFDLVESVPHFPPAATRADPR